jgi:UDP-perosamine 4-acetyltransferase
MKDKIIIIGGGGHAKVLISDLIKLDKFEIIGYTDLNNKGLIQGVEYLGTDKVLPEIKRKHKNCGAVIGVGNISVSNIRSKIYKNLKELNFDLPVIISIDALVNEEVSIGEGTVVLQGAIINVSSVIGKCVIINTGAIVEHDSRVDDFVHLTAGSIIGAGAEIGENTIMGIGSMVIPFKKVCKNCLIGAGTIVARDLFNEGTYFGCPARNIDLEK